jgi:N-acetylglucosaminyldiphosphoundecaprenol N-acetyl-beta-D-mannosaminyltransferase
MQYNTLAFAIALVVAATLTILVDAWERRRLSRAGGSYATADFCGVIVLAALAVGLWGGGRTIAPVPALLGVGALVFLVSALTDQWRPSRGLRLAAALVGGLVLCRHGICISSFKLPFTASYVDLAWLGPVLTALWLALSASLFARAGTIPRVSLGVAALASGTLYLVCRLEPEITGPATRLLTLLLFAATLPMALLPDYLTHRNATAGFYLVGFLIGAASTMGALKHTALLVALVPLMIVGVPLFATAYSWLADLVRRRRPQRHHHPHLHEILLRQGYSREQVATILLTGTAFLCAWALLLVVAIQENFILKLLQTLVVVVGLLVALYVLLRLMRPARPPQMPDEVHLLGVRVDRVTMAGAMARVEEFMRQDTPHMIVTSDATGLMRAQDDDELRAIVNAADLVTADGAGVILSARLLNLPLDVRVSGCDMVGEICQVAARLGRSVYLLGAAPGVAEKAAENLQKATPGLEVAGCRDGYFKPEDEPALIADIAAKHPGALFVALGIPRQEKWIKAHMAELGVPVCIGIGGSFDVISGLKKRAPVWMQRTGLEWLYRVAKEPSRLPRLVALPRIVLMSFAYLLRPPTDEVER